MTDKVVELVPPMRQYECKGCGYTVHEYACHDDISHPYRPEVSRNLCMTCKWLASLPEDERAKLKEVLNRD